MDEKLGEHALIVLAKVGMEHAWLFRLEVLHDEAGGKELLLKRLVQQVNGLHHRFLDRLELEDKVLHLLLPGLLVADGLHQKVFFVIAMTKASCLPRNSSF